MTEYCPWFIIQLPVPKNHFFKIFWKVWSIYFKISWKYWRNACRVMSLSRSNLQPHNSVLSLAKWLNTSTVVTMSYWSSKSFLFGDRKYAILWLKIWTCNIYYCVCSTEKAFLLILMLTASELLEDLGRYVARLLMLFIGKTLLLWHCYNNNKSPEGYRIVHIFKWPHIFNLLRKHVSFVILRHPKKVSWVSTWESNIFLQFIII